MSAFLDLLDILAGLVGHHNGDHPRRVGYRASGELLETRNLQSSLSGGLPAPGFSHPAIRGSLIGVAEVRNHALPATSGHMGMVAGASGSPASVDHHPGPGGVHRPAAVIGPDAEESGKNNPKDGSGVELAREADSEKIDPKDGSGVELAWVDQAAVVRLARS